jgi:hypothetical protein
MEREGAMGEGAKLNTGTAAAATTKAGTAEARVKGAGVRVRKVVAGRAGNSMVAVVLECERVRVGQAALVDPSAPRYTSLM